MKLASKKFRSVSKSFSSMFIKKISKISVAVLLVIAQLLFSLSPFLSLTPKALADAADPDLNTTNGVLVTNPNGTITLTVNGNWKWTTRHSNCNLDKRAVGFAVDWNDPTQPGNVVTTLNSVVIDVGAATGNALNPADNFVHPTPKTTFPAAPYGGCGTYVGAPNYNIGTWGPLSHTYPVGTTSFNVCSLMYDVHLETDGGVPKSNETVAGGADHNTDNSAEENDNTPLGNGCFTKSFPNLTTQVSGSSIGLGQSITDTASLSGTAGSVAGSVKFYVCGPGASNPDCSTGGSQVGGSVAIAAGQATSSSYTPAQLGKYCFRAEYTPAQGSPYAPVIHTNTSTECFEVTPANGNLVLVKSVTNNNGGGATENQFGLTINGQTVTSGQSVSFAAGATPTINEAGLAGYSFVSITGAGCPQNLGGTVTIVSGQTITCTITNDDIAPTLKLVKYVTNNNGGNKTAADFQGKIDGNNVAWSVAVPLSAGAHTASEVGLPTYTASSWGGDCNANGTITLALDQDAVCSITNDDNKPTLTLVKNLVDNYNSGYANTAWTLFANGPTSFNGVSGVSSDAGFDAGQYTLDETGPAAPGFIMGGWNCTGTNNQNGVTLTVNLGDNITCTVTNTSVQPKVKVIKHVVDNYGGGKTAANFEMTLNGTDVTLTPGDNSDDKSVSFPGSENGTYVYLDAGTYDVSEGNHDGYESSPSGDCDDEIAVGQEKTCTITNTAIQPKLKVVKIVENGTSQGKSASEFTMNVSGTNVSDDSFPGDSNGTTVTLNVGSYQVTEGAHEGYKVEYSSDCQGSVNLGDEKTCTVTNTKLGTITIVKDAQPDSTQAFTFTGNLTGNNGPNFDLIDDGVNPSLAYRVFTDMEPGTYNATEPNVKDWDLDAINCEGGSDVNSNNQNVVIKLKAGENVTCTFVNKQQTGHITVHKVAYPGYTDQEFTINLRDAESQDLIHTSTLENGESDGYDVPNGEYVLNEENIPEGWDLKKSYCYKNEDETKISPSEGFEVTKGDSFDCTFVNKQRGSVVVTKFNDQNRNEWFDESETTLADWTINLDEDSQVTDENGKTTFTNLLPGYHNLSEEMQEDWSQSTIYCYYGENNAGVSNGNYYVKVYPGATTHCYIGNFKDPELNIVKSNDSGASKQVEQVVTYSIVLSIADDGSILYGPTVNDTPPAGFTYVSGSWTANSNLRGDLKASSVVLEPNFGVSPVVWTFDGADTSEDVVLPGETITLTYQMKIGKSVVPGVYTNYAYATACGEQVEEYPEFNIQSLIAIDLPQEDPDCITTEEVHSDVKVQGVTIVLANTGTPSYIALVGGIVMIGGALLVSHRKFASKK